VNLPTWKVEQTVFSEMLAYEIQTLGNYPEESIQLSEHGECLKSITVDEVSHKTKSLKTSSTLYQLPAYFLL